MVKPLADKDINNIAFVTYHSCLVFKLFVAFTMIWTYPVQKEFVPLKTSVKTFQLTNIENLTTQASNFYFYNALDIFRPKVKTVSLFF